MYGSWTMKALVIASLVVAATTLVACKEGTLLPGVSLVAIPDLEPASPTASDHYVSIRNGGVTESRLLIDVAVTDVAEPVSGIALKVSYPSSIARFSSCKDGDLLPTPGTCFARETTPGSGEVFVGRSIQAPQASVAVSGTKTIVQLEFIVFAEGSGALVFEAQNLGGGDASAVLDANGDPIAMQWFSGNIVGR